MGNDSAEPPQRFRISHQKFPAAALSGATAIDPGRVSRALRERFGDLRSAAKRLAVAAEAQPRTAENWLYARCPPSFHHLLLLMAREPAVDAVVRSMVEEQRALDAEALERQRRRMSGGLP